MKQDSLQQLLAKFQEGTLSDEELERLNQLTHRDEVLSAAENRAHTIVRRRTRIAGFAVAATAVLGAGIWMLTPKTEESMMAVVTKDMPVIKNKPNSKPEEVAVKPETYVDNDNRDESSKAVESTHIPVSPVHADIFSDMEKSHETPVQERVPEQQEEPIRERMLPAVETDPVVVCNNQCDADSVISDIWKFLSA